ncbi:hypothetical protein ACFL2D_00095 [Patescibacteria group bacterium]
MAALLLVPVCIALAGFLLSHFAGKGKINWKEFAVQMVIVIPVVLAGWYMARGYQMSDTEIWNGTIAKKWEEKVSCCHSYQCNCYESCTGTGANRSCSTICQTCYEHSRDKAWKATTSNGEMAYNNGCNSPSSHAPHRWNAIVEGEPTAIEHEFVNYIKANPDSVMRRHGVLEQFGDRIPEYPRVYDHYRADRYIVMDLASPDYKKLNYRLNQINGRLGVRKQVNIIVILTKEPDQMYLEALTEAWVGGKKNDLVVIVGAPDYPKVGWVGVMSWTTVEKLKLSIRDRIMELPEFDGMEILNIVEQEVDKKFLRRQMAEFEYLKATIEPPAKVFWTLFGVSILLAVGLQIFFYKFDPFHAEHGRMSFRPASFRRRYRY